MDIEFQFPQLLVLITVVPIIIYIIHRGYTLRESMLSRFQENKLNVTFKSILVSILSFCILASLLLLAVGPKRVLNNDQQNLSGNIVFMVDVSRSMAARQACNESTRLDRTREIMTALITDIPEAKFGFMGVAGLTFVLSELSFDRQYLFDLINHGIFIEVVPMPGSDLANAFHVFLEKKTGMPPVYEAVDHVILFSDGDIAEEEVQALDGVVPLLVQSGIEVNTIGVGEDQGIPIPTLDANGQCITGQYERADGKEYYTHLLESPLITVAESTGGNYFHETQVEDIIVKMRSTLRDISGIVPPQQTEDLRYPFIIILALSLFCLLLIKRI